MRWFKHLTRSHEDEKLAQLRAECGLAGYGLYWIILEIIARNMENNDQTSITLPIKMWSKMISTHSHFVLKVTSFCTENGLIQSNLSGQDLTIGCDNLLKYKDEYLRKSGQKKSHIRNVSHPDLERDLERDKDKEKNPPTPQGEGVVHDEKSKPKTKSRKPTADYSPDFEKFWSAYPRGIGKAAAWRCWQARIKTVDPDEMIRAAVNYAKAREGEEEKFTLHASTFLGPQCRWLDYVSGIPASERPRPTMDPAADLIRQRIEEEKNENG